jgi:hypothetical protein
VIRKINKEEGDVGSLATYSYRRQKVRSKCLKWKNRRQKERDMRYAIWDME